MSELLKRNKRLTYLLLIRSQETKKISVGKLGKTIFAQGIYVYIGSAKKNWVSRIKRHLSNNKKKFWHIDYLLMSKGIKIKEVLINPWKDECTMAQHLIKKGFSYIKDFGNSDCKCLSHLIFVNEKYSAIKNLLKSMRFTEVIL